MVKVSQVSSGVGRLASAPGKLRKSYISNQLKFDVMILFLTFNFTNILKYTIYNFILISYYYSVIVCITLLKFENLLFSLYD
jgi:hypothetical protein